MLEGDPDRWSPETEILLFTAARRDHLEKTIRPGLARGEVVITDRFADSTRMYQGITAWRSGAKVDDLHRLMIGVEPDLTFLIDIDPDVGLARAMARAGAEQRFEDMGLPMQAADARRVSDACRRPSRAFAVIDGARAADTVAADVLAAALRQSGMSRMPKAPPKTARTRPDRRRAASARNPGPDRPPRGRGRHSSHAFNSGRLHHGWLITGPRGVGKATLAWKIARFLLATPEDDGGMFAAPPPSNLDIPADHPIVAPHVCPVGIPPVSAAPRGENCHRNRAFRRYPRG